MKGLACLKSKVWWNAALTRMLKTVAQTAISCVAVKTLWEVDVVAIVGIVALAAIGSLLTSMAGIPEVEE